MLEVSSIDVYYGDLQAIWDVSLTVQEGDIVTLLGANGAGKSTLLKTIVGWLRPSTGTVSFYGVRLDNQPTWKIVGRGICFIPEGKGLFQGMSVLENLEMGAFLCKTKRELDQMMKKVYQVFPILEARKNQIAETLSGGEQQMLAIGRALMSQPRLMLLDEISSGLAPLLTQNIFGVIKQINQSGVSICVVEQNAVLALELADRAYVIESGHIVMQGNAQVLLNDKRIQDAYLGVE
jgi:branched-chain amino acid transport system ATP-binding protein